MTVIKIHLCNEWSFPWKVFHKMWTDLLPPVTKKSLIGILLLNIERLFMGCLTTLRWCYFFIAINSQLYCVSFILELKFCRSQLTACVPTWSKFDIFHDLVQWNIFSNVNWWLALSVASLINHTPVYRSWIMNKKSF